MNPKTSGLGPKPSPSTDHVADPVLLDFLAQDKAPYWRGHDRLARVLQRGDENVIKSLILAASHVREDALGCLLIDDEPNYKRALKLLGAITKEEPQTEEYETFRCVLKDETMLRLIEVAGDVLDWDGGDPEFGTYVARAWPVLQDEFEWEQEGGDDPWNRIRRADRSEFPRSGLATRSELEALETEDLQAEKEEKA